MVRTFLHRLWDIWPSLLLLLILVSPIQALAGTVSVSRSNIKLFSQPNRSLRYACYNKSSKVRAGSINTKKLAIGTTWSEILLSQLNKSISAVRREIARAKKTAVKKKLTKELRTLLSHQSTFVSILALCAAARSPVPSGPEFLGDPNSLSAYREQLTTNEINHLLNKVAFGGSDRLREIGRVQGLSALVYALVDGAGSSQSETQLQQSAEFWADTLLYRNDLHSNNKIWTTEAAQVGQTYRLFYSENPFKEWMTLFWAAHFAINLNRIDASYSEWAHRSIPEYWKTLREKSLGNFRELAMSMVTDGAMCAWLNNDDNRADSPNQNFAREFMELFTLGAVDPVTGTPNYTEEGIAAATGYFSGFYEDEAVSPISGLAERVIRYDPSLHDATPRTIFRGVPAAQFSGEKDWQEFANYVLDHHPGAPRYLAERLFAQMIQPDVPSNLVSELAHDLTANNYELKPILRKLLSSQAMFSSSSRGVCINSPVEVLTRLTRRLHVPEPSHAATDLEKSTWYLHSAVYRAGAAGETIFEPPSVFAWKGACGVNRSGTHAYGEGWITAQSLLNRVRGCTDLMNSLSDQNFDFSSVLPAAASDPGAIVQSLANRYFDLTLSAEEQNDLIYFLTHDKDPAANNGYRQISVDLTDSYYVARKIPRVLCLISDLEVTNEK